MKRSVPASQTETGAVTGNLNSEIQVLIAELADIDIYNQRLRQLLERLRVPLSCDAAVVMCRIDEHTAKSSVYGTAPSALLDSLTSPAVFAESIERRTCQFVPDYRNHPAAVPALKIWGAVSVAFLPIVAKPDFQGAVLLVWRRPQTFPDYVQTAVRAIWSYLQVLIPLTETTSQLEEAQERISTIVETIPQGIVFLDEAGRRGWINSSAARLLDLERGAVAPRTISMALAQLQGRVSNREDIQEQAKQLLADPAADMRDCMWELTNPELQVLRVSTHPTRVGEIRGRIWVLDDVTGQRKAQIELGNREHWYRELFETTPLAALIYSLDDSSIVAVNQAAVGQYGYSGEEFLQLKIQDLWPEGVLPASRRGEAEGSKEQHVRRNGEILDVEIAGHEISYQGRPARVELIQDITERERIQQSLRESEERYRHLIENAADIIYRTDREGKFIYWNSNAEKILGYSSDELSGSSYISLIRPDRQSAARRFYGLQFSRQVSDSYYEFPAVTKGGEVRWIGQSVRLLIDNGAVSGFQAIARDITDRKHAELALTAARKRIDRILATTPNIIYTFDLNKGRNTFVNREIQSILGYTPEQLAGMGDVVAELVHPDDLAVFAAHHDNCRSLADSDVAEAEYRSRTAEGEWRWLLSRDTPFSRDALGRVTEIMGTAVDITRRKRDELALREQDSRWKLIMGASNDGLWDWNARTNRTFYSPGWKHMFGFADDDISDDPREWESRVHPDDLARVQTQIADHLNHRTPQYNAEYRIRCRDGSYKWVLARGKGVWDEAGRPLRLVGVHTDITARKENEARLTRDALFDSLTGLANRRLFDEEFARAIRAAESAGRPLTVALCDLDRFKQINDVHGHAMGDEVLMTFGQILQRESRQGDLAARFGGDEFCLLFPGTCLSEARTCLERIRLSLSNITFESTPPFQATATFGAASLREGMRPEELLAAADEALYAAKRGGRNKTEIAP